jgi:hypothetical protein
LSYIILAGAAFYPTHESAILGRMVLRNATWLDPSDPIPAFAISDIVKFGFIISDFENLVEANIEHHDILLHIPNHPVLFTHYIFQCENMETHESRGTCLIGIY